ncbi:NUDIX hydrolase [Paludibacter propionicigenes WB4]|uniref:NUDIX hydrolase n=1 Tax=Paludibacter propionicigenes (strain DSM 17365 / JCM 13257 / WB4) TaxID=694427 RepID=E4T5H9_PALPW|nr:CoA pyrophosphatase [Paludibacter propionicigenes]ADQ79973.1 NUDIX hydrolase [Paludibacter propionicigenes WB4]
MLFSKTELKQKFQQPLPGTASHLKMAPPNRAKELLEKENHLLTARQSAVMVLLFPSNNRLQAIYIKRSEYDGVHSGQIAFPGGKQEKTDPGFEATALRETFEEIGVTADKIEIIGQLSDLFIPPSNFIVKPFVGYCTHQPAYKLDPREIQAVVEIDLADFYSENRIFEKEFSTGTAGKTIKAPYFAINGIEIWGATAMITSELLDVLNH